MRKRLGSEVENQHRRHLLSAVAMSIAAGVTIAVVLALSDGSAISAQDKYTVQTPNGLAFSEFR
jgi:hypothetical protein